jgi:hypothetical protein
MNGDRGEAHSLRFTYTGRTRLIVTGSATGRLYRFEGTGATLPVDRRDAYSLAGVSVLRRESAI